MDLGVGGINGQARVKCLHTAVKARMVGRAATDDCLNNRFVADYTFN